MQRYYFSAFSDIFSGRTAHKHMYLHAGVEGRLLQKSSSWDPMAESRPLQSHCHLGSRVGSGPTNIEEKTKCIYKKHLFPIRRASFLCV